MKANSKKSTVQSAVSTASKKAKSAKRGIAKAAKNTKSASSSFGVQQLLDGAAPYALPGAGVLATAALAVTGYFLRNGIASFARGTTDFARGTTERGVGEMLRMLHLERRSMHWMSTLGAFAGGVAVGAIAGAFVMPRAGAAMQSAQKDTTAETVTETPSRNDDRSDGVVSRIPNGSSTQHSS